MLRPSPWVSTARVRAEPPQNGRLAKRTCAYEAPALGDAEAPAEVLRPRQKYPDVEVVEESRYGSAAVHVVDASREASLVVVGRRIRRSPFGAHIGHVTHAVLHHSTAPVAVVPHG